VDGLNTEVIMLKHCWLDGVCCVCSMAVLEMVWHCGRDVACHRSGFTCAVGCCNMCGGHSFARMHTAMVLVLG